MKNAEHSIQVAIDVTPAEAWGVIAAVKGVDQWLAPITACRVEGNQRICTTESGEFVEDILKVDSTNRVFEYGIPEQNMMPIRNIIGSMKVTETPEGKAQITWTWKYEVEAANDASAKEGLTMIGTMGITGIESLIKSSAVA